MDIEYEAKFLDIDKVKLRKKLKAAGARLVKPERLYRRAVFFLPKGHEVEGGWVRVRDEGDRVTMSFKVTVNGKIDTQKEITVTVDNYDKARQLLSGIGCVEKAYQETKREIWRMGEVEITIDEWPYLEPYVEIEGVSEELVRKISEELGFNYGEAIFGAADQVLSKKYGLPEEVINDKIKRIVFNEPNPYLAWLKENKAR